jgi:c-di-GMP-binding flagellar brake protein YcgR
MVYDDFKINRRKWHRESVKIQAQYFLKGQSLRYQDCTIVNLSRSGAGVLFPANSSFAVKTPIYLEIIIPQTTEQFTIRGEVKNKHTRKEGLVGGIQFETLLPENMLSKLALT